MDIARVLAASPLMLAEAAVLETLRRDPALELHPVLEHALLFRDPAGKRALSRLARQHAELARREGMPVLLGTPSFRANAARLRAAGVDRDLNQQMTEFMRELQQELTSSSSEVVIAGIVGPRGDCYTGTSDVGVRALRDDHRDQIEALASAGVDLLLAATMPTLIEARAVALEMAATGVPYIISAVLDGHGQLLDHSDLSQLIDAVDTDCRDQPPLGFGANCCYPTSLMRARGATSDRIILLQANGSARDPSSLEGSDQLQAEAPRAWASAMKAAQVTLGLNIVGGCCGTGLEHLELLIAGLRG